MVNLRGTKGSILKIRARDRDGRNIHRNQFSIDDLKSVERELRIWKDKLGVPLSAFKKIVENPIDMEELNHIKEMMGKSIEDSRLKVIKAMGVNPLSKDRIK